MTSAYNDCVAYVEELGARLQAAEEDSYYLDTDLSQLEVLYKDTLADLETARLEKDNLMKSYALLESRVKASSIATPICLAVGSVSTLVGGILIGKGIADDNTAMLNVGIVTSLVGGLGATCVWSGGHWIFKFW